MLCNQHEQFGSLCFKFGPEFWFTLAYRRPGQTTARWQTSNIHNCLWKFKFVLGHFIDFILSSILQPTNTELVHQPYFEPNLGPGTKRLVHPWLCCYDIQCDLLNHLFPYTFIVQAHLSCYTTLYYSTEQKKQMCSRSNQISSLDHTLSLAFTLWWAPEVSS